MKIQLIHPPVYINKNGLTALRPSLPLGLAYIAAVLRDDGHDISVIDALGEAPERMVPEDDIWRLGLSVEEIVDAMYLAWQRMKIVIEPSSAVPLATILKNREIFEGKRVGVILTGGNVDLKNLPWMQN